MILPSNPSVRNVVKEGLILVMLGHLLQRRRGLRVHNYEKKMTKLEENFHEKHGNKFKPEQQQTLSLCIIVTIISDY